MLSWFRDRVEVLRLLFKDPSLLWALGLLQTLALVLYFFPFPQAAPIRDFLMVPPWYAWALTWLTLLWLSTLGYSAGKKKLFDETSRNFFRAYVEHLLHQGHGFFSETEVEGLFLKAKEWQRQAIQGIAIGLGPEESERFFQKMEAASSLTKAYRRSEEQNSTEPLWRSIQVHLEELERIRLGLLGTPSGGGELVAVNKGRGWDDEDEKPAPKNAMVPREKNR